MIDSNFVYPFVWAAFVLWLILKIMTGFRNEYMLISFGYVTILIFVRELKSGYELYFLFFVSVFLILCSIVNIFMISFTKLRKKRIKEEAS